MKIAIGCDHGGLELKNALISHLSQTHEITDHGTYTKDSCHYPIFAEKVAKAVASGEAEKGILICTTGIGVSMAANKVRGVRAAVVSDCFTASATRRHNDANVLCMGQGVVGEKLALLIADTFLAAEFEGGRHQTRIDMITDIENREATK